MGYLPNGWYCAAPNRLPDRDQVRLRAMTYADRHMRHWTGYELRLAAELGYQFKIGDLDDFTFD